MQQSTVSIFCYWTSPLLWAKMAFLPRSDRQQEEEGCVVWWHAQWVDGTWCNNRGDKVFTWYCSLFQSVVNKLHHLGEKLAFSLFFERSEGCTRRKEQSLKAATSWSIVLWVMVDMMDSSLGNIYCLKLLLSNFTTFMVENGIFPL